MRIVLIFVGMVIAATTSASSADYFWISNETDTGVSAALVGCNECDDIALQMVCERDSKIIKISLFSNYASSEPQGKNADKVVFHMDDKKTVRAAAMTFDEMNAGWLPIVTINARDPLIRRILKAGSLRIEGNGTTADISLGKAAKHIKKMRRSCR